jgi:hypothetical protein
MDAATRQLVWQRADGCCEYCRMRQEDEPFCRYHVEHIIPQQTVRHLSKRMKPACSKW